MYQQCITVQGHIYQINSFIKNNHIKVCVFMKSLCGINTKSGCKQNTQSKITNSVWDIQCRKEFIMYSLSTSNVSIQIGEVKHVEILIDTWLNLNTSAKNFLLSVC